MCRNVPFKTSRERKKHLYQSLILPILLYCSPVWHPSISDLKNMERFQKKVLKWIVSGVDYNEGLCRLNILPLCYQLAKVDMIHLWKVWHKTVEVEFTLMNDSKPQNTRCSNSCFQIPKTRKFKSSKNVFPRSIRIANESIMMNALDFDHPLPAFKKSIDSFFQKRCYPSIYSIVVHFPKSVSALFVAHEFFL